MRLAQVVVSLLQGAVNLRLMRGQGDVFAHLQQKLAFTTGEAANPAGSYQNAEDVALNQQERCDQRAQPTLCQWLRKRQYVRLMYQLAVYAPRKPILVKL